MERKEACLRYLQNYWTSRVREIQNVFINTSKENKRMKTRLVELEKEVRTLQLQVKTIEEEKAKLIEKTEQLSRVQSQNA
jgi:predicted nuclease with TOPRIM domain